jgi:hypothetical protein
VTSDRHHGTNVHASEKIFVQWQLGPNQAFKTKKEMAARSRDAKTVAAWGNEVVCGMRGQREEK